MNMHILSHLVGCVKNWGPIWCYSCFAFETRNSDIKRLFHGSRDMSKQVMYICAQQIIITLHFQPQMAFSYIWMQVIPRVCVKNSLPQVQAVHSMLHGKKRFTPSKINYLLL